jgi:hypothetical protein
MSVIKLESPYIGISYLSIGHRICTSGYCRFDDTENIIWPAKCRAVESLSL